MPVQECQINGQKGYKWGEEGICFPGKSGRSKAIKQGRAITISKIRKEYEVKQQQDSKKD